MPRCFMAKKLKYPYQQWKQEQEQRSTSDVEVTSRSPSPSVEDHLERSKELASTASAEIAAAAAVRTGHDLSHNGGKWCFPSPTIGKSCTITTFL